MESETNVGSALFERRGISLSTYSESGYLDANVANLIRSAAAGGANCVVLGNIVLADLATGSIGGLVENGQNQTASLASVATAIEQADAAGVRVILKPQIAVRDAAFDQYNSASWINMVNPALVIADPAIFFANYKAMLLDWAAMAQRYDVDTLCIGNEMVAATKPEYTSYWNDIIAAVRTIYDGQLTYAALAPVMTNAASNEITQIGFWDKLDYAGFDVYPSLTHDMSPTVADLNAGWRDTTVYGHRQDYRAFLGDMAALVGKPVVFTETGLPSFDGASDREATSDGTIGDGTRATDQKEQADWWQSFFETWALDAPDWLKGVYLTNNDPGDLGSYRDQNYNIDGKLAEAVVAAWFGGNTALGASAFAVNGSQADDRLYLYDPGINGNAKTLSANLSTTVKVIVTANIVDGRAPTIHAYVNGTDFGQIALQPIDSGYVDSGGAHWTSNATYTFTLPGLVAIDQLKLGFDSPATIGNARSQTFFHEVSVNGVALTHASYTPVRGGTYPETLPVNGTGGSASQWGGGYTVFDASPWNTALTERLIGSAMAPIAVDGGAGRDSLFLLGRAADYLVVLNADGSFDLRDNAGYGQNAHLVGIEALAFEDGVRFDLTTLKVGEPRCPGLVTADSPLGQTGPLPSGGGVSDPPLPGAAINGPDAPSATIPGTVGMTPSGNPSSDPGESPSKTGNGTDLATSQPDRSSVGAGAAPITGTPTRGPEAAGSVGERFVGTDGADTLIGSAGEDYLDGGAGIDRMVGGDGNDTYLVDNYRDQVIETAGGGNDFVRTTLAAYVLADQVEDLSYVGNDTFQAMGNALDNVITGGSGVNRLIGGTGNDVLTGGGAADTLDGGAGADRMIGGGGNDIYFVDGAGDWVVEDADRGLDLVYSAISYALGANVENLWLFGDRGVEGIGNALANTIVGNAADNRLAGGAGNDMISGGAGSDMLNGGDGDDTLIGEAGSDVLTGGTGADRFTFWIGDLAADPVRTDTITDFARDEGDRIDLSAIDADPRTGSRDAFTFIGAAGFGKHAGELRVESGNAFNIVYGDVDGDGVADFAINVSKGSGTLIALDFVL